MKKGGKCYRVGRVEEAYLLIDAATEDVKAILDDVA